MRNTGMRLGWALLLVLAATPLLLPSNALLNFGVGVLIAALAAQGWNIIGGLGGQLSFGHAAFYGTGAYCAALLQLRFGWNAFAAAGAGVVAGATLGAAVGAVVFRAGLRGSYFALVTLAIAEVLRILANAAPAVVAALLMFGSKRLRPWVGGLALGSAAVCSQIAFSGDVAFFAGGLALRVWMVVNVLACAWIARLALDKRG